MNDDLTLHCRELNRCNQRVGRMLSVPDLLQAGTLSLDLAAFLMSQVYGGSSFMVGARPGGVGKTVVMCALLNLVAPDCRLVAATPAAVASASRSSIEKTCYICHEIGAGHWFGYLWGPDLRAYCALSHQGYMLATNLHADDVDEARNQVCGDNSVPESDFSAFRLLIFLKVSHSLRRIEKVCFSDGRSPHKRVFSAEEGLTGIGDDTNVQNCRLFLQNCMDSGTYTIEAVRKKLMAHFLV